MSYIVARDVNKIGCVAFKIKQGPHLANLERNLVAEVGIDRIEILTISRPAAYGEYAPYTMCVSEDEFISAVRSM